MIRTPRAGQGSRQKPSPARALDYPFVPVPTAFFDHLPSLSGAESKVLLCVLRQTAGWRTETGERKRSDWISQSQFKAKTGLASAAISRAIDALVRQGLLIAEDDQANLLTTAADRRRLRGRVYFGAPSDVLSATTAETPDTADLKSGIRKTNRTKESSPTKELSASRKTSCRTERGEGGSAQKGTPTPQFAPVPMAAAAMTGQVDSAETQLEEGQRLLAAKERCRRTLRTIGR